MYVVQGFFRCSATGRERDITFRTEWCYWLGSWRGTLSDSSRIILFYPAKSLKKMKFPLTRNSDFFCEMEWAVPFKPLFLQLFCTRRKGITAGGEALRMCSLTSASVRCSAVQVQYKRGLIAVCAVCNLQLVICVICVICAYCSVQKKKTKAKGIDGGGLSLWVFLSPTPHLQSHYGRLLGMYKVLNISQRIRNSFPPGKFRLLSWNPFRTFLYWWGTLNS